MIGASVTVLPTIAKGLHVYVDAPLAVKVAVEPIHNTVGVLVIVIVGVPTLIEIVWLFEQPNTSVPLSVYTVVVVGFSTDTVPVVPLGVQL